MGFQAGSRCVASYEPATENKKKERVESADNKRSDRRASCIIGSSSALSACTHVLLDKLVKRDADASDVRRTGSGEVVIETSWQVI